MLIQAPHQEAYTTQTNQIPSIVLICLTKKTLIYWNHRFWVQFDTGARARNPQKEKNQAEIRQIVLAVFYLKNPQKN
jgi:hypothetical protein